MPRWRVSWKEFFQNSNIDVNILGELPFVCRGMGDVNPAQSGEFTSRRNGMTCNLFYNHAWSTATVGESKSRWNPLFLSSLDAVRLGTIQPGCFSVRLRLPRKKTSTRVKIGAGWRLIVGSCLDVIWDGEENLRQGLDWNCNRRCVDGQWASCVHTENIKFYKRKLAVRSNSTTLWCAYLVY